MTHKRSKPLEQELGLEPELKRVRQEKESVTLVCEQDEVRVIYDKAKLLEYMPETSYLGTLLVNPNKTWKDVDSKEISLPMSSRMLTHIVGMCTSPDVHLDWTHLSSAMECHRAILFLHLDTIDQDNFKIANEIAEGLMKAQLTVQASISKKKQIIRSDVRIAITFPREFKHRDTVSKELCKLFCPWHTSFITRTYPRHLKRFKTRADLQETVSTICREYQQMTGYALQEEWRSPKKGVHV